MRKRAEIEKEVRQVRQSYGVTNLPVDVEDLARQMGVSITFKELEEKTSGALFAQDGQAVIAVNDRHSQRRQRFTMAHELGHYVLHWKAGGKATAFVDGALSFRRDALSEQGELDVEIEANAFAAELLMPRLEVEKLTAAHQLDLNDEKALRKLSAIFKVSEQALTVRLVSLGLLRMLDMKER